MQPRDLNIAHLKGARFKPNRIKYQTVFSGEKSTLSP